MLKNRGKSKVVLEGKMRGLFVSIGSFFLYLLRDGLFLQIWGLF